MPAGRDHQWPADKVERRPITGLIPYANNARTHSETQVAKIAASMREWGWTNPILVDEQGTMDMNCAAMELAPEYADVAVKRWQDFTGQQATLEGDGRTFAEIAAGRQQEAA